MPANWRNTKRHLVEPALADLIDAAADQLDRENCHLGVIITEGARTHERQRELKRIGASKTLRSRHIPELNPTHRAYAVDVAMTHHGKVVWDWPLYEKFSAYVKAEAKARGVPITWGGDWKKLRDGPHYELA